MHSEGQGPGSFRVSHLIVDGHVISDRPSFCLHQGDGMSTGFSYQVCYECQGMLLEEVLKILVIERISLTCRVMGPSSVL